MFVAPIASILILHHVHAFGQKSGALIPGMNFRGFLGWGYDTNIGPRLTVFRQLHKHLIAFLEGERIAC
ncbi:MAG: hypothetical protein C4337_08485 [Armatimonadota bacterium]